MKKIAALLGLVGALLTAGCLEQDPGGPRSYKGPLFRYHAASQAQLLRSTNASRLKEISALPVTAEFRGQLAGKLAAAAHPFFKKDLPPGAVDKPALLRPLLDDFLTAEAFVEVQGAAGGTESVLAVALNEARAGLWNTQLKQLMSEWKLGAPKEITAAGFNGWEVRKAGAPGLFRFIKAGQWVLLGLGPENGARLDALLAEVKRSGRPVPARADGVMDLSMDCPGLRRWVPLFASYPVPPMVMAVTGRGENVRTEIKFQYSGRLSLGLSPWQIPTNIICEPLTSFTAGQGIASILGAVKGFSGIGFSPLPNQFYGWALKHPQYRCFFGFPLKDGNNTMQRLSTGLPKFILSEFPDARGQFVYDTNRSELVWINLPFLLPFLHPERDGGNEFLIGGNIPLPRKRNKVPDELFSQIRGRTNLVYYDWEITQERFIQGTQFYQLASMVDWRRVAPTNTPSKNWTYAVAPKLGNTVTEITQTGPQELVLVRKSHLGFTGFELATFSAWLDSTGFPFSFPMPPRLPGNTGGRGLQPDEAKPSGTNKAAPVKLRPVGPGAGSAPTNRVAPRQP